MAKNKSKIEMKNIESADVSNLLELALKNISCSKERIVNYTFLIEEALIKWREKLPSENQLQYRAKRSNKKIVFTFQIEGEKVDPFVVDTNKNGESAPLDKMLDNLLSGVGSEIKYFYKKGKNIIQLKLPIVKDYERALYARNLIIFILPIAIQQFFFSISNNIDVFMLGFVDANSMSVASLVSKFSTIPDLIGISIAMAGVAVLSQYWGKRDRKNVNQSAGIIIKLALYIGVFFALVSLLFPRAIISFYTNDKSLIELGAKYLRIIAFPIFLNLIERVLYCFMQVVGDVKKSMRYSLIVSALNIVLNGILVFGLFGLPQMGIVGAGITSIITFTIQGILLLIYTIKNKEIRINFITKNKEIIKPVLKIILPTVAQFLIWLIFSNFVTSAFGHKSSNLLAADSILSFLYVVFSAGAFGLRSGTAVFISRYLGKNKLDTAKVRAGQTLLMATKIAFIIVPLYILAGVIVHFIPLDLNSEALYFFDILMIASSIDLFIGHINTVNTVGILEAGGDATGVLIIDLIVLIGCMVTVSVLSITGLVNFSPEFLIVFLYAEELLSFPLKTIRFKQYRWLKSITKNNQI